MTADVLVVVPVWNRPERAAAVCATVEATANARVLFVVSDGDTRELLAVRKACRTYPADVLIVDGPAGEPGDYARKINRGMAFAAPDVEWLFQGADDLHFHPGWFDECLAAARDRALVVGTNDLCNPRTRSRHSTHSLIHRDWLEHAVYDEPGHALSEAYWHNFVDDELIYRAGILGVYAHAGRAHVEHLHPNCGRAERDTTYDRALDRRRFAQDRQLLRHRQRQIMRSRRPVLRRPTTGR